MASCERIATCPLFRAFSMKSSLKVWQAYYCESNFSRCERWKLVQLKTPVPMNLLPNGRTLTVPLDQLEPDHMT
jgi:hypothetical protein